MHLSKNNTCIYFRVQQHSARIHKSYRDMSEERRPKSFREGVCASSEADSMTLPKIVLKGVPPVSCQTAQQSGRVNVNQVYNQNFSHCCFSRTSPTPKKTSLMLICTYTYIYIQHGWALLHTNLPLHFKWFARRTDFILK